DARPRDGRPRRRAEPAGRRPLPAGVQGARRPRRQGRHRRQRRPHLPAPHDHPRGGRRGRQRLRGGPGRRRRSRKGRL
ncbi:MAG: hypothetical protein AVDCRST_MAG03-1187, partial [uncultured Rubrobacteraceae bacterium]